VIFALVCLGAAFITVWMRSSPTILIAGDRFLLVQRFVGVWAGFLLLSLIAGFAAGNINWQGLSIALVWACLWASYIQKEGSLLFFTLVILSFGFTLHLFPGCKPVVITQKFSIGYHTALLGIFPLVLLIPLAKKWDDWVGVFKGILLGCAGIALMAILAVAAGVVHWQFSLPSFAGVRYANNLFFVAIPEEAFYRGFMQHKLSSLFQNLRGGKMIALVVTSLIFTLAHLYWAPSPDLLAFVFIASLLYGGVYLYSGKIESAIISHFLLNFIHMTFFSYHAS
jgi:hypothetical protein